METSGSTDAKSRQRLALECLIPGYVEPACVRCAYVAPASLSGHYRLRIGFSDGSSRDVDLTGELHGPVFEPLADPDFFAQVRVDDELGTVVWPNGADLDPPVLHGDFEPAARFVHR